MSWEEIHVEKLKCPCGKGTYTVRLLMDDWNRSEENWEMDCPICKKKYQLYEYNYHDSGLDCKAYLWVVKKLYEEMVKDKKHLEQTKISLVNSAKTRYKDKWLFYFHDAKTKKEVWRKLTDDGNRNLNLSTFFSHTQNDDIIKYVRDYFNYNNLLFILNKLEIKDNGIEKKTK